MIVRFNLDFDDVMAFQKDFIEHSKVHKSKRIKYMWFTTIILFSAPLLAVALRYGALSRDDFLFPVLGATVWCLCSQTIYNKQALHAYKKQLKSTNPSFMTGDCVITISNHELIREFENSKTIYKWSDFIRITEDSARYFLYNSDFQGLIIKKKHEDLTNEEQKELKKQLQNHVPKLFSVSDKK